MARTIGGMTGGWSSPCWRCSEDSQRRQKIACGEALCPGGGGKMGPRGRVLEDTPSVAEHFSVARFHDARQGWQIERAVAGGVQRVGVVGRGGYRRGQRGALHG